MIHIMMKMMKYIMLEKLLQNKKNFMKMTQKIQEDLKDIQELKKNLIKKFKKPYKSKLMSQKI